MTIVTEMGLPEFRNGGEGGVRYAIKYLRDFLRVMKKSKLENRKIVAT